MLILSKKQVYKKGSKVAYVLSGELLYPTTYCLNYTICGFNFGQFLS
jgi:hypothetical protein